MELTSLGLAGLGFWLAVAAIVIGCIWAAVRNSKRAPVTWGEHAVVSHEVHPRRRHERIRWRL